MLNNSFDVIIPVATKDSFFIRRTVDYINENLVGVSSVYLMTAKCNIGIINRNIKGVANCVLLDEDSIIEGLTFSKLHTFLSSKNYKKTGWLFQQFLKMGFARSQWCRGYYLSWDADTLPLNKIDFFYDGHPLFTQKKEYHAPYFDALKRILGFSKVVEYSFIAENMLFDKVIMNELLSAIEQTSLSGKMWYEKVLGTLDYNIADNFSEFETYGTFCTINHPNLYHLRTLNTLRCGAIIRGPFISREILQKLSIDVDTISLELWHKPPFPWNIPHFLLRIYVKLVKSLILNRQA